ncbi:hypothetical protein B0A48_04427 [Cryoendolithus antarcticus]|uniref:Uncharacterized protein n=1 Tax=Cryoendolithus antarcticus TaxID=1507870 RepID=A0A1V8TFQ5_9PEZI|nr:hypothetical protein B0A48_04427 [Cryoendolithus antarcticus]
MSSSSGAIYIIAVGGGTVVTKANNGLFDKNANGSASQHWTVEYGEGENIVAFQNAETGQWLHCFAGNGYGKIDTGEKQWWTLEEGPGSPGSYWLKSNDFPNAYLCNAYGAHADGNKVYAWPRELNWTHALTWHFKDAQAPGFKPKDVKGASQDTEETSSSDSGAAHDKARDLEARETNVAEKERKSQDLDAEQKQKRDDLEKREAVLAEKERGASDFAGREAALAEKEKRLSDLDRRDTALSAREQALAAKEAAVRKQGDQLSNQGKNLADIDSAASGKSKDDSAAQAAGRKKLEQAERTLAAREAAAAKREELAAAKEKANKAKEVELEKKLRAAGTGGVDEKELLKAQNENLKLQLLLKDLERRLAKAETTVGSTTGAIDAARLKRLEDENARLKNLVAQQVLKKTSEADKSKITSNSSRPVANSSRPVAPATAVAGLPKNSAPSGKPTGSATNGILTGTSEPVDAASGTSELSKVRAELARTKAELAKAKRAQRAGSANANGLTDSAPSSKPGIEADNPSSAAVATSVAPAQHRDFPKSKLQPEPTASRPATNGIAVGQTRDLPRSQLQPEQKGVKAAPNGAVAGQHRDSPKGKLQPDAAAPRLTSNGHSTSTAGTGSNRDSPKDKLKPAPVQADAVPKPGSKVAASKLGMAGQGSAPKSGPTQNLDDHEVDEDDDEEPIHFECGHIAHQRPRKLRKKLVGMALLGAIAAALVSANPVARATCTSTFPSSFKVREGSGYFQTTSTFIAHDIILSTASSYYINTTTVHGNPSAPQLVHTYNGVNDLAYIPDTTSGFIFLRDASQPAFQSIPVVADLLADCTIDFTLFEAHAASILQDCGGLIYLATSQHTDCVLVTASLAS